MIDWERHGFNEDPEYSGCYSHPHLSFIFEDKDNWINIYAGEGLEYPISKGNIPATNRQIELIKKAFCVE